MKQITSTVPTKTTIFPKEQEKKRHCPPDQVLCLLVVLHEYWAKRAFLFFSVASFAVLPRRGNERMYRLIGRGSNRRGLTRRRAEQEEKTELLLVGSIEGGLAETE